MAVVIVVAGVNSSSRNGNCTISNIFFGVDSIAVVPVRFFTSPAIKFMKNIE